MQQIQPGKPPPTPAPCGNNGMPVYDTISFNTTTCVGANAINSVLDYFWPWDNCTNGFERYTALYTVNPTFNCPADSRTLQVNGSAYETGSWAFTAYQGVKGVEGYTQWYQGNSAGDSVWGTPFAAAFTVAQSYYSNWPQVSGNPANPPGPAGQGGLGLLRNTNKFSIDLSAGNLFEKNISYRGTRLSDCTDGTSNTLFVGERPPNSTMDLGWWFAGAGVDACGTGDVILGVTEINFQNSGIAPVDACDAGPYQYGPGTAPNPCDMFHYWSFHSGGGNWLYADASVHFLPYTTATSILQVMSTYQGGEAFTAP
jgi:prepilin-type processing-associated H-X9-DG protein